MMMMNYYAKACFYCHLLAKCSTISETDISFIGSNIFFMVSARLVRAGYVWLFDCLALFIIPFNQSMCVLPGTLCGQQWVAKVWRHLQLLPSVWSFTDGH